MTIVAMEKELRKPNTESFSSPLSNMIKTSLPTPPKMNHVSSSEDSKVNSNAQIKTSTPFRLRRGFLAKKKQSQIVSESIVNKIDFSKPAELVDQGNCSVVYKVFNKNNEASAVFKPYEQVLSEDSGKLTLSTREQALNEVCAYKIDKLSPLQLQAGIPETRHVKIPASLFSANSDNSAGYVKGSLQQYVVDGESCEDYGPSMFSKDNVHKAGILDLKILNCDRHTGNFLLQPKDKTLVPIDHALSFPEIEFEKQLIEEDIFLKDISQVKLFLKHVSFDWLMFPQAKLPFSEEILQNINELNITKQLLEMGKMKMSVSQKLAAFCALKVLKVGAVEYEKTLFELGSIVQRSGSRKDPSILENLVAKALEHVETKKLEKGEDEAVRVFCSEFVKCLHGYFRI